MTLIQHLQERDKAIHSELHYEFSTRITKLLGYFFEISDIRDLVDNFVEEEKNLFDRIVTKFLKVSEKRKLQDTQSYTYYTNIIH